MVPRRSMASRYQHIFLGHYYSCNNFGHKALNYKAYGKVHFHKKNTSNNYPKERKGNHNSFAPLQSYDIECYKCNNHGHITRECKLMTPTENNTGKRFQDKEQRKVWKKKEIVERTESMIALCAA
jgi:hypothetical protein